MFPSRAGGFLMKALWHRFRHWALYSRCDLCLKDVRRPLYRDRGDLGYWMCFDCALIHDAL